MSLITYVATALVMVGLVSFVIAMIIDRDGTTAGAILGLGGVVVAVAGLVTFAAWGVMNVNYNMTENECDRFSEQAEVETKMVRYNSSSWDCLVRSDSGWVTKSNYWNSEDRP